MAKNDLDATVFKDDNSAVFPFLIEFTDSSDPIHDFNNYAVFKKTITVGNEEKDIDVDTDLVLARSEESIPGIGYSPWIPWFSD